MFGVIWFVFSEIVHAGNGVKNYSAYILMALVLFQFFLGTVTAALSCLVDRQNLLAQDAVPAARDPAVGHARRRYSTSARR